MALEALIVTHVTYKLSPTFIGTVGTLEAIGLSEPENGAYTFKTIDVADFTASQTVTSLLVTFLTIGPAYTNFRLLYNKDY
jgi:hypothetical protein